VSDTLASVLKVEPDWSRLPTDTPAAIRRLLRRCLTKDRRQRLQAIGDARLDIDEAERVPTGEVTAAPRRGVSALVLIVAVLAALIVGAAAVFVGRPAAPVRPETRLDVLTPPTSQPWSFALSPDGQQVVFVATSDSGSQLWLRPFSSASARPLARTEGATAPFWSPDGRSIAFFSDQKLRRIDLEGGAVQVIADALFALGGTWSTDGVILFSRTAGEPILRVSATGGAVTPATKLDISLLQSFPRFLPGGRQFLFFARRPESTGAVYLGTLDSTDARRLVDADSGGELSPSGELLFVRQGTLFAAPLDIDNGRLTGMPTPVAEGVLGRDANGMPAFSVARSGVIAYRPSSAGGGRHQFAWFDRTGRKISNVGDPDPALVWQPSLSPDDSSVVLWRVDGNQPPAIWILDLNRSLMSRFSNGSGLFGSPIWSPDGGRIVFTEFPVNFYEQSLNAPAAEPKVLWKGTGLPTDWSSDGRFMLFTGGSAEDTDVMALRLDGEVTAIPIVKTRSNENNAKFSPDHRWIAYRSYKTSRSEVFIQPFPGPGADVQVSTNGGAQPRWSRDGKEIFYIGLDGKLMAAPVQFAADGMRATVGQAATLFASHVGDVTNLNGQLYDVSRDGKRFLIATVTEQGDSPIVIIANRPTNR
jgi:Tol biopolymer transport system component